VLSDSVTHSDTLTFLRQLLLTDIVTYTDNFARVSTIIKVLTENVTISTLFAAIQSKVFQEVVTLIENLRINLNGQKWYARTREVFQSALRKVWEVSDPKDTPTAKRTRWYTRRNTDWEDKE
jgi:hypothetical protein